MSFSNNFSRLISFTCYSPFSLFLRYAHGVANAAWYFEICLVLSTTLRCPISIPAGLCTYTSLGARLWINRLYTGFFPTLSFSSPSGRFNFYCVSFLLFVNRCCFENQLPVRFIDSLLVVGTVYLGVSLSEINIRVDLASVGYRNILFGSTEYADVPLVVRCFLFYVLVKLSAHNVKAVHLNQAKQIHQYSSMMISLDSSADNPLLAQLVEKLNSITGENNLV